MEESGSKKRLGRGMGVLLGASPVQIEASIRREKNLSDVKELSLIEIDPSPFQPRSVVDHAGLDGLAQSIKESGLIQPITVRRVGSRFELIAGERRWRAAAIAGLVTIPALVREVSDEVAAEHALIENVQREDLNPIDRGVALKNLVARFNLTQDAVAKKVGLDRSSVSNLIRITDLEPGITDLIANGTLSAGHGKALLSIPDPAVRQRMATLSTNFGWTVRRLEREVQDVLAGKGTSVEAVGEVSPERKQRDAVLRDLERQIGQHLGTKVQIHTDTNGKRGRLQIEFYGLDHFDGVLAKMGVTTR